MVNMTDLRAQAIQTTVPIREVLGALGVHVTDSTYQILCPVHQERNPSARIYPDAVYCFTCAKRWDAVALVQAVRKLTFEQALDWCEEMFGVKNPSEFVDSVVPAVLRRAAVKDFTQEVAHLERLIKKNKCAIGVERYNRAWLALDTAVAARKKGTLDDDAFEAVLKTLAEFATTR